MFLVGTPERVNVRGNCGYATLLHMMGYGYGSMMAGWGLLGTITWLVIVVDLVLVGIWLWQNISKK
ncbi:MAG: hypothetical protein AAB819_00770 [Patescibacteria group bacterium]